jgi:hypothetical protein
MKENMRKYYEVRTKADDGDYFVEPAMEGGEENYNPNNLKSAKRHAREVGGWVVEIIEKVVMEEGEV